MTKRDVKRYYPTPALEKGLDILELFAGTPEGLTVSEAARRLNRTVSEIFRMILCLEQRGYLAQSPNKERYHLTRAPWKWFEGPIYRFINRKNEESMRGAAAWLSAHPEFRPDLIDPEEPPVPP